MRFSTRREENTGNCGNGDTADEEGYTNNSRNHRVLLSVHLKLRYYCRTTNGANKKECLTTTGTISHIEDTVIQEQVNTHLPTVVVVIFHKQIPEKRSGATFVDDWDICSIIVLIKGGCKNQKRKQCLLECVMMLHGTRTATST